MGTSHQNRQVSKVIFMSQTNDAPCDPKSLKLWAFSFMPWPSVLRMHQECGFLQGGSLSKLWALGSMFAEFYSAASISFRNQKHAPQPPTTIDAGEQLCFLDLCASGNSATVSVSSMYKPRSGDHLAATASGTRLGSWVQ